MTKFQKYAILFAVGFGANLPCKLVREAIYA